MSLMEITLEFPISHTTGSSLNAAPAVSWIAPQLTLHHEMYDTLFDEAREALSEVKHKLDDIELKVYYATRDALFPLAHSGSGTAQLSNRAAHKLQECMDATGVWEAVVPGCSVGAAVQKKQRSAPAPGAQASKKKKMKKKKLIVAFADVCGGPGSFSQLLYLNAPQGVQLRGYGMTLLDSHNGAPQGWYPELLKKGFTPCFGVDGQGNIYNTSNIIAFQTLTQRESLKLVVADGGFEVPMSQANIQEVLSARIIYGQWYCALRILQKGGCFVLKMFDNFSPNTRSILYLSTFFYEKVHIVKPKHSRIVNSERYLICMGFRDTISVEWERYLEEVHRSGFDNLRAMESIVPPEWMQEDKTFHETMSASVSDIAQRQTKALQYLLDSDELKTNQENVKNRPSFAHPATTEPKPAAVEGDGTSTGRKRERDD